MQWINYHHIIYFKAIAESESISKASELLKVGQPALSIQLKTLEESIGVKLFDRSGRNLTLTREGHMALEYAKKIDGLGKEMFQVLQNETPLKQLSLRLGALDSVPKSLICSLTDFAYENTGCQFSINEGDLEYLMALIEERKIDFAILDFPLKLSQSSDLECHKIFRDQICAFSSKKFQNVQKSFPKSLEGQPCIFPTHHSKLREDLEAFFFRKKLTPRLLGETQDTSVQKLLACKGDGIVFLPEFSTKELVKERKLINLGALPRVFSEYFLISKKRKLNHFPVDLLQKFEG